MTLGTVLLILSLILRQKNIFYDKILFYVLLKKKTSFIN